MTKIHKRFRLIALLLITSVSLAQSAIATPIDDVSRVYVNDNSDWWSLSNPSNPSDLPDNIKSQERKISNSNCQILGLELGVMDNEPMYNRVMAKLGKATVVLRGDAGNARMQTSYVSTKNNDKVYLIFEEGDIDTSFYLFIDSHGWNGNNYVANSNLVSRNLTTASGLHLGLTPEQVIEILGKPNINRKNEIYYWFMSKEKTPEKKLVKSWQEANHRMSYKEFRQAFEFHHLSIAVDAKFLNSKLIYLAVSKVESN